MLSRVAAPFCFWLLIGITCAQAQQQQQAGARDALYIPARPGSLSISDAVTANRTSGSRLVEQAGSTAKPPQQQQASSTRTQAKQQPSSSTNNPCQQQEASSVPWGLTAVRAASSGLPTKTDNVLICLISSGVVSSAPFLKRNKLAGCTDEHPLDPGGCELDWNSPMDKKGNWKPRGTYAASIIAASSGQASSGYDQRIRGVIPDGTELYVVPVNADTGSLESSQSAAGGSSRIRAYGACEGRLRGLQARDFGVYAAPMRWRMVMLVDVEAKAPAAPLGSRDYRITEQDWLTTATGKTIDGFAPDVLVVAPAGSLGSSVASYPAAFPQVVAVGGYTCEGQPLSSYVAGQAGQPDLLAPGKNIPVPDVRKDGLAGVRTWEGSAAAAAYAAGAAARLWSKYPACGADAVKQALLSSKPAGGGSIAMLNLEQAEQYLVTHKC